MRRGWLVALAIVAFARSADAKQVNVASAAALTGAIAAAQPGDEIVVASGAYTLSDVDCSASGTASQPIVVRAATPFAAQIHLGGHEGFRVSGAHWTFTGLEITGGCGVDSDCAHAFHVFGGADGFVLRGNHVTDFDAQVAVDASPADGGMLAPSGGLVEGNVFADTHARNTSATVVKIDVGSAAGWIVRANYMHDFARADAVAAYGAVLRAGGKDGVFERNLVICSHDWIPPGNSLSVGLSVGGDGTDAGSCAPDFDAGSPCLVEQTHATLRNNVVVGCDSLGIAVNRGADTRVWFNTVIDTPGVDFAYGTTTGEARGNVLSNAVRTLGGAIVTTTDNLANVSPNDFLLMYRAPLDGDLRLASQGSVDALVGKGPTIAEVTDDYCARTRSAPYDLGALQSSLGDCDTVPPPLTAPEAGVDSGADAGLDSSLDANTDGSADAGPSGQPQDEGTSGCGCGAGDVDRGGIASFLVALAVACAARAIRYVSSRSRRYR